MKLSLSLVVFSRKGFHVNIMFFLYFVFLHCVIDHNRSHASSGGNFYFMSIIFHIEEYNDYLNCDAPKFEGPFITHQPVESLWISCNSTLHRCVPFTRIHNLTNWIKSPLSGELYLNLTCAIIQSHDPLGAQYNTLTALGPFMSKK